MDIRAKKLLILIDSDVGITLGDSRHTHHADRRDYWVLLRAVLPTSQTSSQFLSANVCIDFPIQ